MSLQIRAKAELELRSRQKERPVPEAWNEWLSFMFPAIFAVPFASHQVEFWEWIESITLESKPTPFIAIWARGGGKTSSVEAATVRLAAKGTRRFCLYIRSTQDKANESVTNIASMLESRSIAKYYPLLSERKLSKYGFAKGWRVDTLRCASGFSVIGLGLDAAVRGIKIEEQRPDAILFDDLDDIADSPRTIVRKIEVLTTSILPAGASNVAVCGVQNLIHEGGVFAQLATKRAGFLLNSQISGPHPAVENLTYVERPDGGYSITGGSPTWEGQNIKTCESQINEWGLTSFLREAQHQIETIGNIWAHINFAHCEFTNVPDFVRSCVWVDPAVTATNESDCQAIQADALGSDGKLYRLYSWESIASPEEALTRATLKCLELGLDSVGVETDQGGDTWQSVYAQVWLNILKTSEYLKAMNDEGEKWLSDHPNLASVAALLPTQLQRKPVFKSAKAGSGHGSKLARNQRMLVSYEQGKVIHVIGTHATLERSLKRFPTAPLDLADAAYWGWYDLIDSKIHSGKVGRVGNRPTPPPTQQRQPEATEQQPSPYITLRYKGNRAFPLTIGKQLYMIEAGWQRAIERSVAEGIIGQFSDHFEEVE